MSYNLDRLTGMTQQGMYGSIIYLDFSGSQLLLLDALNLSLEQFLVFGISHKEVMQMIRERLHSQLVSNGSSDIIWVQLHLVHSLLLLCK
jgi:hypothetical protein